MIQIVTSFCYCIAFGIIFHLRGKNLILAAVGGALAWTVYLLTVYLGGMELVAYFLASSAMTIFAETAAYMRKVPVAVYLGIEMIPLVPGRAFFYSVVNLFFGHEEAVYKQGMYALQIAGMIALGIYLTSTVVKMYHRVVRKQRKRMIERK